MSTTMTANPKILACYEAVAFA